MLKGREEALMERITQLLDTKFSEQVAEVANFKGEMQRSAQAQIQKGENKIQENMTEPMRQANLKRA